VPVTVLAQGDAAGAIASAKQQIIVCYDSARQAEAAGANISSLTSVLNDAGQLLSRQSWRICRVILAARRALLRNVISD